MVHAVRSLLFATCHVTKAECINTTLYGMRALAVHMHSKRVQWQEGGGKTLLW